MPSLSPKSYFSKSLSSGSLDEDFTFDSPQSLSRLELNCVESAPSDGQPVFESVVDSMELIDRVSAMGVSGPVYVPASVRPKPVTVLEQELVREAERSLHDNHTEVSHLYPTYSLL